jgi:hypothetical protein
MQMFAAMLLAGSAIAGASMMQSTYCDQDKDADKARLDELQSK